MHYNLQQLLEKFYALRPPQASIREAVAASVRRYCDIELSEKEIECRGSIVYLRTSPTARSEILMRREELLRELREEYRLRLQDLR